MPNLPIPYTSKPLSPKYTGNANMYLSGTVITTLGIISIISALVAFGYFTEQTEAYRKENQSQFFYFLATGIIAGVAISGIGFSLRRKGKAIPPEPIEPPKELVLIQNEQWRNKTSSLRYLENIKERLQGEERHLINLYQRAIKAHQNIPNVKSKAEYDDLIHTLKWYEDQRTNSPTYFSKIKDRIEKILKGDVQSEILENEVAIEKLKREKIDQQQKLTEVEAKLKTTDETKEFINYNAFTKDRDSYRSTIKTIDLNIIELTATVKELKNLDISKLYKELGITTNAVAIDASELNDVKAKADTINAINPSNNDDRQKAQAKKRFEQDIEWEIETKAGEKTEKLHKLQEWKAKKLRETWEHPTKSGDQKIELSKQIEKDYESYKKKIEQGGDVNIYD